MCISIHLSDSCYLLIHSIFFIYCETSIWILHMTFAAFNLIWGKETQFLTFYCAASCTAECAWLAGLQRTLTSFIVSPAQKSHCIVNERGMLTAWQTACCKRDATAQPNKAQHRPPYVCDLGPCLYCWLHLCFACLHSGTDAVIRRFTKVIQRSRWRHFPHFGHGYTNTPETCTAKYFCRGCASL